MKRLLPVLLCLMLLAGCVPPAGGIRGIVKIGLVAPFSMAARNDGYSIIYAVKLALNEWNARGGAGGYRFELVTLDDNNSPATAVQRARELNVDDLVMGVVGHYGGDTTMAAVPEYRKAELPLVVPFAGTDEILDADWPGNIRIGPNNTLLTTLLAEHNASTWQASRVVLIHQDTQANRNMADALTKAFDPATIAGREVAPPVADIPTVNAVLERAKAASPGLVVYTGNRIVGAAVAARAKALLPEVPLVMLPPSEMDTPDFVKLGGNELDSVLYGGLWSDPAQSKEPPMVAFVEGFQKLSGAPPRTSAVLAYDAANILFAAIEQAVAEDGRPTRRGVLRNLRTVEWNGLTGKIRFDERGESLAATAYLNVVLVGRYPGNVVAERSR